MLKDIKKEDSSEIKTSGIFYIKKADIKEDRQWELHDKIALMIKNGVDFQYIRPWIDMLNRICAVESYVQPNLNPTVGRTMIANNLSNTSPTTVMRINYSSLGTGTAAPANSDTTLATETYRKLLASYTNSNNIAYFTAFYTGPETSGVFKEAGLFAGATATANSGVLFSRVLLSAPSGINKTLTNSLTIDYVLTIS